VQEGSDVFCALPLRQAGERRGDAMAEENYICRKCGWEFKAIPGKEEPPECPECASDEVEKLELATIGKTTERK